MVVSCRIPEPSMMCAIHSPSNSIQNIQDLGPRPCVFITTKVSLHLLPSILMPCCLVLSSFLIKPPVAAKSDDYTRDPNASHRNKTLNLPIAKNTSHDRRHRTMAIELLNGIVGEKGCDQQSVSNGRWIDKVKQNRTDVLCFFQVAFWGWWLCLEPLPKPRFFLPSAVRPRISRCLWTGLAIQLIRASRRTAL